MFTEHDRPEVEPGQLPEEQDQFKATDAAQRRISEQENGSLDCEHASDTKAEAVVVDRCARIMARWEKTNDPVERRYLLEQVGKEVMNSHEAPPAPIHAKELPLHELGAYVDDDFRTDMNEWQFKQDDPRDALETYLHEYRHDEQNYEVLKSHGALGQSIDGERASAVEANLKPGNYIHPKENQEAYQGQLVEKDAEKFGTELAGRILERMQEVRDMPSPVTSDADAIARRRIAELKGGR